MSAARRPLVLVALLLAASLVPRLGPQAQALTDASMASDGEPGVDPRVRPGDDFFAYANGDWLGKATIPAGQARWTVRNEIDAATREQVAALLAEAAAAPPGSEARKLADFQAAYMDEASIEARGLRPLKPVLDRIAALGSKAALVRHLGRSLRADVDPLNVGVYSSPNLFGLAVERGIHGETTHFAYLLQGGLGLPDREPYLADSDSARQLRIKYRDHIGRMLALAGFEPALQRADAVLALETAIARCHVDEAASSSERNADHRWTRAEFKTRAPGIDWDAFFDAAGLSRQQAVTPWQPDALVGEAALLAAQPLAVWKDYLRFHQLDQQAALLPRAYAEQAQRFRDVELAGKAQPVPRAQRARDAAMQALPDALGRLYAQRHFPPEAKARVQAIAGNVIAALARRVEVAAWMAPESRAMALAKLKVVYFGLGYPEKWTDHGALRIDPADAFGNRQRIADWNYRRALDRLGQAVDLTEWVIPPQAVSAYFLPLSNAYNFAAALLQPPKFDPAASDAVNYGAIGAIVGHEVSHLIDTLGADYDVSGAMKTWWTAEDKARFEAVSSALVRQFADYQPLPGLAVDGQRTLSENVADLGGLAAAYDAYRATPASRAADKAEQQRQDRQFFIAFARSWRSVYGEGALRNQLKTDTHAPERYRIATVRNLDAWYEAFDVRPGQALYLAPAARVRIW